MTAAPNIVAPTLDVSSGGHRGPRSGSLTAPERPVLRYHGGKWRIADWVISHFPPHEVYVEVFGGAASVLLNKPAARIEVYNDLDDGVVGLFRILRDSVQSEELRRMIELTPFSRAEFDACWKVADDPLEEARRLIVRAFQCLGSKDRTRRNGWRTRTAKSRWSPCVAWNGWPDSIPAYLGRMKDTIIENQPWQKMLTVYDDSQTLFYLDPPYLSATRSNSHAKVYAHEMADEEHAELLDRVQGLKSMVVLSGYHHPMYEAALKGWRRFEVKARAQTNAPRVEVLWLNPAAATRHHAPDFGFTESGNNELLPQPGREN